MVPLGDLLKRAGKLVTDNSPVILTAIGVTCTVATAYLTGKASFKAAMLIHEEENARGYDLPGGELPVKEKVDLVWKLYIPAAVVGTIGITAVVFANRVGSRRAAAIAAAYSLSERAFEEYKTKVVEKLGPKREEAARAEIAQARVDRDPVNNSQVILTSNGSQLCFESFTGRYFLCDMETLRKAVNDINHDILHDSYCSLSEFYVRVGLPQTSYSDEVGWNTDHLMELKYVGVITDDGRPCIAVDYVVTPIRKYSQLS